MMTGRNFSPEIKHAIDAAWDPEAAALNIDRWLSVCHHENLTACPENLELLIKLFGASWYFTRLVFYRGREITHYFDSPCIPDFTPDSLHDYLDRQEPDADLEQKLDDLRLRKNEIMLQIFLLHLDNKLSQDKTELALTRLSEAVLRVMLQLIMHEQSGRRIAPAILAMGRMAGAEMNYGSDLDLIFLFDSNACPDSSGLARQIQRLLRYIALPTPCGILYEIDMRLRPHGTSGTLISPIHYFIEYHQGQREIWERQMMTRCRPVYDPDGIAANALDQISHHIYASHDQQNLSTEIIRMRARVEHELGSPAGKYEVKRGLGGIMDIDFLTHYMQLLHGSDHPQLQTPSTRIALQEMQKLGYITANTCKDLLQAYDYLKMIEGVLRVHDMKNINVFSREPAEVSVLARALGHLDADRELAGQNFLEQYVRTTQRVRSCFQKLVGDINIFLNTRI